MKKTLVALAIILIVGVAIAYAQNPGMMGGQGGWYCPYSGQWMGPGMMGKGMMGPCMGGQGMMSGQGMMGGQAKMGPRQGQQQQLQKPLEEKDARAILENYITNMKNPNLQLGKIKDAGTTFEAEILTKDNSLVDKIMVDKATGWMRSAY
ncbi:MAG: hypothetical protein MIO92_08145 [Methanosarcinaceae archaeon]|nr:hypothetical protein [Methanosarcinaceae archaeon]